MKREDFGAERWFSQWCAAEWLGFSARLCFCRLFFYLFFKTLSLCDLFLNPLLFIGVIFPFILAPVFFLSVSGDGVGAQGLSTGIKSALLNFS